MAGRRLVVYNSPKSSKGSSKTLLNSQQSDDNTLQVQYAAQQSALVSETINVQVDMEPTEQPTATESRQTIPNTSQSITNSGQATNGLDSTVEDNTKSEEDAKSGQGKVTAQNNNNRGRNQSRRWLCFMFLKVTLIVLRFVFCFLIVPLLQLQLFSDYAWYCLLNNVVRNYCHSETNIGLDHSLMNYCVYLLLLIALLFSFLINWFPKGILQFVLLYKGRRIMINKKGKLKSQFDYMTLVNESDNE